MTTLAPGFVQALPSLTGVPRFYEHEAHAELLHHFCAALVREGLGSWDGWARSGESPLAFAQHAIQEGIGADRRHLLQRNVEYYLQVSDVADRGVYDTPLDDGKLLVTIECSGAGFVEMGPVIETLEREAEGLGAAFYWNFTRALYRVMRLYDHDDALQYEERLKEYAEDDGENAQHYEFPDVMEAFPPIVRRFMDLDHDEKLRTARVLIHRHRNGPSRAWFDRLRRIERLSRYPMPRSRDGFDQGNYDSGPLPSLIVVFEEHDAIHACFDEESQYMLECIAEPTFGLVFSLGNPAEVQFAIKGVSRFVALNVELFSFIEGLQQTEVRDAGTGRDRGEPSLRAAWSSAGLRRSAEELRDAA